MVWAIISHAAREADYQMFFKDRLSKFIYGKTFVKHNVKSWKKYGVFS